MSSTTAKANDHRTAFYQEVPTKRFPCRSSRDCFVDREPKDEFITYPPGVLRDLETKVSPQGYRRLYRIIYGFPATPNLSDSNVKNVVIGNNNWIKEELNRMVAAIHVEVMRTELGQIWKTPGNYPLQYIAEGGAVGWWDEDSVSNERIEAIWTQTTQPGTEQRVVRLLDFFQNGDTRRRNMIGGLIFGQCLPIRSIAWELNNATKEAIERLETLAFLSPLPENTAIGIMLQITATDAQKQCIEGLMGGDAFCPETWYSTFGIKLKALTEPQRLVLLEYLRSLLLKQ